MINEQIDIVSRKVIESKTLIAFLILFSPFIIGIIIFTQGKSIGIPDRMSFTLGGIFYPYIQIVLWIYWMWYSTKRLIDNNDIDSDSVQKYFKVIGFSKTILVILICGLFVNSILPSIIDYPDLIDNIVKYLSYGLIIVQLYLFYALIYGFWIISKTINDICEKNGRQRSMSMILFFLMPLTFGVIHKTIRKELGLQ